MLTAGRTDTGRFLRPDGVVSTNDAPVGVLDSGLGGLSVVRAVQHLLPQENILYFADSAFCPYGLRDADFILNRTIAIVDYLVQQGIKLLVVACNTACAVSLVELRTRFSIPIIGLEPAVKPAAECSKTGRIGVLATPRTIASQRLRGLVERYAAGVDVELIPAHGWVELVERGETSGERVAAQVRALVAPAVKSGCDALVLGCTHYPFLQEEIQAAAGEDVVLVESGPAIARRVDFLLSDGNVGVTSCSLSGSIDMVTSGQADTVCATARELLGRDMTIACAQI